MPDFLKQFDGSGRTPRPVQVTALEWLASKWDSRVLCLNAPTGSGKSAIAKAIAVATGAHVITPSNILVDQYNKTYPAHNALKGRAHYTCHGVSGFSCQEWVEVSGEDACARCPYVKAKERCFTEPTFFNPMSLYYTSLNMKWKPPSTIVVDEAHTLSGMILQICGTRLRKSEYRFTEEHTTELQLVPWMTMQLRRLSELMRLYKSDHKRLAEVTREYHALELTCKGLREDAQNYAVWIEDGRHRGRPERFLNIKPIKPPLFMVRKILNAKRLVLMSGTLFDSDITDLVGDVPYEMLDMPSPIPIASRQIHYVPMPFPMNKDTNGSRIVHEIEAEITKRPGLNTLVHVTYALGRTLAPQFRIPIIYNDQSNKDEQLELFKRRGGVFLAAGCAEGVDLPGNLCRLNIIPKLPFPDMKDPVVAKRKAAEGGDVWYALQTMKTLIQQCGRSTRGESDFSTIVIKDPNFARLYRQYKQYLPKSFTEAIIWGGSA